MTWITFETTKEEAKNFINSIPNQYWHQNKDRFFKKEHNCSLLMKEDSDYLKFILVSSHADFTSFMLSRMEELYINYSEVKNIENTTDYIFLISKEIDQHYCVVTNQEIGSSRVDSLRARYLDSHLDQFTEKFESVLSKIAKYEFEFSFLIATSYLEELVSQAFKQSFQLDRFGKFKETVNTSLTFSFKIEFLYAIGFIDDKTSKTLYHIRKIRNHLAHQSVLEQSHTNSITSHIENIQKICDNGILSRPETTEDIEDDKLKILVPVVENLCIAFIGATHFINSFIRLGGVHYANKGYGRGFYYSVSSEYVNTRVSKHLESKFQALKIKEKKYNKYGFNLDAL